MNIRAFRIEDREAALQIWREVGWIEGGTPTEEAVTRFIQAGRAVVAEIGGRAEALATTMPGDIRIGESLLPFSALTSVTAGRVARKSGAAGAATARVLAEDAEAGAAIAGLSMFEQGYYDRLGFGTGSYEHYISFDPAALQVPYGERLPVRLEPGKEAGSCGALHADMHAALCARMRPFCGVNLHPVEFTALAAEEGQNCFGLGFYEKGELTHFFWGSARGDYGPYRITFMAYRSWEQLIDLLGVLRRLGDQVRLVKMIEPPGFQMQSVLRKPFTSHITTRRGEYEVSAMAEAFWQLRILDLPRCLTALSFPCAEPLSFVLELDDPISTYLQEHAGWRGIDGEYTVTLGLESSARPGADTALPRLRCSMGTLSRLLFGVAPATCLAAAEPLEAPPELLQRLEEVIKVPRPHFNWYF